jgi:hypothetical protein
MNESIFILIALLLVILTQAAVYFVYKKTQKQTLALAPNLVILLAGLGFSVYIRFFAPVDGWGDIISVVFVILSIVAFLASGLTSFLILYLLRKKK